MLIQVAALSLFGAAAIYLMWTGLQTLRAPGSAWTVASNRNTPEELIRRNQALVAATNRPTDHKADLQSAPAARAHSFGLEASFARAIAAADKELQDATGRGYSDNLAHRSAWIRMVESLEGFVPKYSGKGVVICGGGPIYFSSAVVSALLLRKFGSQLPVEIWHAEGETPSEGMRKLLQKFTISFKDGSAAVAAAGTMGEKTQGKRFPLKAIALVYSDFEQVLFLDADNFAARNPDELFETAEYKETGALFWPDYMALENNDMWEVTGTKYTPSYAQESGQMLIHKGAHWKSLLLAAYFNLRHEFYYTLVSGDKDTFQFAWRALGNSYHMINTPTGSAGKMDESGFAGHTMVQHHPVDKKPCFFHRNLAKFPAGLRPSKMLRPEDRTWTKVVECEPSNPKDYTACGTLHHWVGGLLRWYSEGDGAKRKVSEFSTAAGTDLERHVLSIFRQLWHIKAYQDYSKELLGKGPTGTYRQTCKRCKMSKDGEVWMWGCDCEGLMGIYRWSMIPDPDSCEMVGNANGKMVCERRAEGYVEKPVVVEDDPW